MRDELKIRLRLSKYFPYKICYAYWTVLSFLILIAACSGVCVWKALFSGHACCYWHLTQDKDKVEAGICVDWTDLLPSVMHQQVLWP